MTRGLILVAFAAFFAVGMASAQEKFTVDKVVANVGNAAILYSEVEDEAKSLTERYREYGYTSDRDPFYEALELLMERKLAYNQAQIDSLKIDETMIETRAGEILRGAIERAGGIRGLEQQNNMTIHNYEGLLKQRVREMAFAEEMQREIMMKVKMTPGEVELFFGRMPADSIQIIPEQYMYAQITRFPSNMKQAKQRVRERLMEMREQVIGGKANFETLARLYSQDERTASRGGEFERPLTLEEMAAEWQPAVERLRPGQVSEVVESEYGFQIIQLIEKIGDSYRLRFITRHPQYTSDEVLDGARFLDSLVRVIRADSITFERAAQLHSNDDLSKQNGGVVTNTELMQVMYRGQGSGAATMFRFRKEDFYNQEDFRVVSGLKPGEISKSFRASDLLGNEMYKIIKLLAVYPTHEANMADDYLFLEAAAMEDKQQREYSRWLDRTIDATYVRVDPAYRDTAKWRNKKWLK